MKTGKISGKNLIMSTLIGEKRIMWTGEYNFVQNIKLGKGILVENGKEYYVEYDQSGNEIGSRKRTFEGVRLMIIGNRQNFILSFYF
jgi:hypothetical protein